MPDFQQHIPPHQTYSNPHHHSSYFSHETATPQPPPPQTSLYAYARQEQLDRAIEETRLRRAADNQHQHTALTIASVVKTIQSRDTLLSDGSNYHK
jgi:hypothetical protein